MSLIDYERGIDWKRFQTFAASATISWDVDLGSFANITLGHNSSFSEPTNWRNGETLNLSVVASGFTPTFPWTNIEWNDSANPDISGRTDVTKYEFVKFNDGAVDRIVARISDE